MSWLKPFAADGRLSRVMAAHGRLSRVMAVHGRLSLVGAANVGRLPIVVTLSRQSSRTHFSQAAWPPCLGTMPPADRSRSRISDLSSAEAPPTLRSCEAHGGWGKGAEGTWETGGLGAWNSSPSTAPSSLRTALPSAQVACCRASSRARPRGTAAASALSASGGSPSTAQSPKVRSQRSWTACGSGPLQLLMPLPAQPAVRPAAGGGLMPTRRRTTLMGSPGAGGSEVLGPRRPCMPLAGPRA
mmetsp:Transcript_97662/g.276313  ORF Transcript_97662/g.276313 Transcript_97662/m.276313 type:complete len:243 (-) Transcript_97662:2-730(-)